MLESFWCHVNTGCVQSLYLKGFPFNINEPYLCVQYVVLNNDVIPTDLQILHLPWIHGSELVFMDTRTVN